MTSNARGVLVSFALLACGRAGLPTAAEGQWLDLSVPGRPDTGFGGAEAGRRVYDDRCWFCHGEDGDGEGPVAPYLWPRPRDFTAASYMFRTTESGELPTDEDLFRTISLGLPGTAMPSWQSVLTAEERWQVVEYIKTFAADLFEDEAFDPYSYIVEPGEPPGRSRDALLAGQRLYDEADCWECHGNAARGEGGGGADLRDDRDFPIVAANLHAGWKFKGGSSPEEIYLRLTTGLDGTPMPSYAETLTDTERWLLAYYVSSLDRGESATGGGRVVIEARRVEGEVPVVPDDPAWDGVEDLHIPLTGQATFPPRWQTPAITDLVVRAVYSATEIAFRLIWDDRTADTVPGDAARAVLEGWTADDTYPALYPDGERIRGYYADNIELMFPVRRSGTIALPHFVYGGAGAPVALWRWRAGLQDDGANDSPVVELMASGPDKPPMRDTAESQLATGGGVWRDGQWAVVVRRALETGDGDRDSQFSVGELVPVAFHVRDGGNGETGLRMAISPWYFLRLREPTPIVNYVIVVIAVLGVVGLEIALTRWMKRRAERGELRSYGVGEGEVAGV